MEENTNLRQQLQNLSSIVENVKIKANDIQSWQTENARGLKTLNIKLERLDTQVGNLETIEQKLDWIKENIDNSDD